MGLLVTVIQVFRKRKGILPLDFIIIFDYSISG